MGGTHQREREARGRRSRLGGLRGAAVLVVVLALVGAGLVAWRTGWAEERWDALRGRTPADGDPAGVAAPAAVTPRVVASPSPVAAQADASAPLDPAALKQALRPLAAPVLGPRVLAAVGALDGPVDGSDLAFTRGSGTAIPASTTKVVTSAAALSLLGPQHTFATTTVLQPAPGAAATAVPRLVLVGGGDPYLTRAPLPAAAATATFAPPRADLRTLARETARALRAQGTRSVALGYDDTLFSGPAINPRWEPGYVPDVVAPISALWVDEGRDAAGNRTLAPADAAAAVFRAELTAAGVRVVNTPRRLPAAPGATPVASVSSATLAQIVQRVLEVSDNAGAEVLLRHVGLAARGEGSFAAGRQGVVRALAGAGIRLGASVLHDGSGLSRADRLAPAVLVSVLRWAASPKHPELRPVITGLPVAGFTGSLSDRMGEGAPDGRGRVRAKTGTLSGVSSLAGIAVDADGTVLAFALMADRVPEQRKFLAQTTLDTAAARLGICPCTR